MRILLKNTQQLIAKHSKVKNVIVLFVLTQIVYFLMLFYTIPNVMSYADGMKILDLQPFGYSAEYVNTLLSKLGKEGRDYYLFRQLPLDMIYPLLYAVTYSLLLTFLFERSFNSKSKIHFYNIIPLFGGFFDYLENIGIIIMLIIYPSFSTLLAYATNIFSILKSISTTMFFVLLIIGIVAILIKKFKKSQTHIT